MNAFGIRLVLALTLQFVAVSGAHSVTGDPCPGASVFNRPLPVAVSAFRQEAFRQLRDVFPDRMRETGIFYQDGAISVDDGVAADWAGLYFVAELASDRYVPSRNYRVVFRATAHGTSEIHWLTIPEPQDDLFFALAGIGFIASAKEPMTMSETLRYAARLEQRYKIAVRIYDGIPGILTVERLESAKAPRTSEIGAIVKAWHELERSGKFTVEPNRLYARIPFEFAPPSKITARTIEFNSGRSVSKRWLAQRWFFLTCPSLPVPIGSGPVPRERSDSIASRRWTPGVRVSADLIGRISHRREGTFENPLKSNSFSKVR